MLKRILVVLAVMLIIAAGVINAQELKFDGYINSGVGVVVNNKDGDNPYFKAVAVDAGQMGYRFRLNGAYTNEAKNAGIRFRLQSQTAIGTGYLSLPYAFGWVSFLDNIITVNAGIVEDSTWTTGDWWLASDSVSHFAGLGALLKIAPVEGLALGVGGYAINRGSGSSNNFLNLTSLNLPVDIKDVKFTFHAGYTMKDVFRLGLSYRLKNRAGITDPDANGETSMLYGEFRYLGLKDLTAVAAARFERLGTSDFNTAGIMTFSETFGYKINSDFNIGLNAVQLLYKAPDTSPSLLFNLWGSYAFDKIVPRLDLVYIMNGQSNMSLANKNNQTWHRAAFTMSDSTNDYSVFSARPSVKINLDGRTFLEIGDMINFDMNKNEVDAWGKKSLLSNVFYIDAKWSF
jgi:hypothetical protein